MYVIYRLTCDVSGKAYIGITNQFNRRMNSHRKCALSPNKRYNMRSPKLYNAIRAHGWEAFLQEIIAMSPTVEDALEAEKLLIEQYDTYNNGLNSSPGGIGFALGDNHPMKRLEVRLKTTGDKHYLRRDKEALERHRITQRSIETRRAKSLAQSVPAVKEAKSKNVSRAKCTLSDEQVRNVRKFIGTGISQHQIARNLGLTRSQVRTVIAGRYTWVE